MKKQVKYGVVGLIIAGVAIAYLATPRTPQRPILPVPNGYDDFLKAAQQVPSVEFPNFGESTDEELRQIVDQSRSALALVRVGFKHQTRVTTDYSLSPAMYSAQHMPILAKFKKLALAFRAEGELAEREGKTNEAAHVFLDGIRFGQGICRGGLLIDRLVGIACERMNLDQLQFLEPELDAPTCRNIARALEQLDADRDSMQAVLDEEQRWTVATAGWRERIVLLLRPKALKAGRENAVRKVAELQARERGLILMLAKRAYRLEHGKGPERPETLVPEYLQTVPKHPLTGQKMPLP